MVDALWSDSEWTFLKLDRVYKEIEKIAVEELGLDVYPNQVEIITSEQMVDAYASIGLPIFYHHWSFGKHFTQNWNLYQKGMQGLAYEIVINSSPCISYLMEENTMTMQALVIAHAAFGHNHFFKNNALFQEWTDAESIIDYLLFARDYISKCEVREGRDQVESFLDSCHALMSYGINRYKRPAKLSAIKERKRAAEREDYKQSQVSDLFDTLVKQAAIDPDAVKPFPAQPEENILYFCEKFAPELPEWKREIIRIVRKISEYFYPQGQCLVGDTYISTRNGMQRIKDIIVTDGYHEHTMDVLSLDNRFEHTSHVYKHRVSETVRVTTKLGRVLEGTPEHPIQVLQPDLSFAMIQLRELVIGVPTVMKLGYDQAFAHAPAEINFSPAHHATNVSCAICGNAFQNLSTHIPAHGLSINDYRECYGDAIIAPSLLAQRRADPMRQPHAMTHGLARMMGYWIAEGNIGTHVWSLSNTDFVLIADLAAILEAELGIIASVKLIEHDHKQAQWTLTVCNSRFREFLVHCGIDVNVRSWTQEIPWVVMQSDKATVRHFLMALFEGDGCNTTDGFIRYGTTSETLARQVQLILTHFGIVATVRLDPTVIPHASWTVSVVSDFYELFMERIGFLSARKNIKTHTKSMMSSPYSRVPYVKKVIDDLRQSISDSPSKNKGLRRDSLPYTSSHAFSRRKIANQTDKFSYIETVNTEAYRAISSVIDAQNYYDQVVSVEFLNQEKDVYDFTIPSNSIFMSDTFVSHNTKLTNEGCATYVHYRIMNRLHEKGLMTDGSMMEFMASHTNVVFQPEFDDPRYSGINPYALGFAMMRDIERICKDPTDEDRRWFPDIAGCNDEMTVLRDAWANYRDESFIRQFLSPKVIRDFGLFRISDVKKEPILLVTAIHDDRGYEHVRESLADNYERHASVPQIEVLKVDPKTRALTLKYWRYRDRSLGKSTVLMKHVQALWGQAVNLHDEAGNAIE